MAKERLDVALVKRGLVESRAKAQSLIMAGYVYSDEVKLTKAGTPVKEDQPLTVRGQEHPYVSRGGLKLAKGIETFSPVIEGITAIDVGASTGGFTDVLLMAGAAKVYAVDVGHGQLAWKLRTDDRVIVLERQNARHLTSQEIPEHVDAVVCDASFIALSKVLETPLSFLKPGGFLCALIKPQFEVGKGEVGKGGVVRDPDLHKRVCDEVESWFANALEYEVRGIVESPIKGPEGNTEFLIFAVKGGV